MSRGTPIEQRWSPAIAGLERGDTFAATGVTNEILHDKNRDWVIPQMVDNVMRARAESGHGNSALLIVAVPEHRIGQVLRALGGEHE